MEQKGKEKFLSLLDDMAKQRENRGVTPFIETGIYRSGGVIPDSFPDNEDPEKDYMYISGVKLDEGDRVLVLWTDAADLIVVGKLEGGGDGG